MLFLASCSKSTTSTGVTIDPDFRSLISPDAKVMAGLNVEKLKSSPLYQRHQSQLNIPMLNETSQRLGFDPRRDLKRVLFVSDGKQSYLLARGDIRPETVEQKMSAMGLRPTPYKKLSIWGDPRNSLVFFKNSIALMGSTDAIHSTLDMEENGKGEIPNEFRGAASVFPQG